MTNDLLLHGARAVGLQRAAVAREVVRRGGIALAGRARSRARTAYAVE